MTVVAPPAVWYWLFVFQPQRLLEVPALPAPFSLLSRLFCHPIAAFLSFKHVFLVMLHFGQDCSPSRSRPMAYASGLVGTVLAPFSGASHG